MDISKLKEAIKTIEESKWIEANPSSRLNADTIISLIDCAQRVIDAAEVLPNKENCKCGDSNCHKRIRETYRNECVDECTAIVAKNYIRRDSLPTKEEIEKLLKYNCTYTTEKHFSNCQWRIKDIFHLAQAILERINK